MVIDAHQHYWQLSRGDYGWLTPDNNRLYTNFLPHHLKPLLKERNVDKTIVVQAAPSVDETQFLLELSSHEPSIAGVVGWLDFEAPEFEEQFKSLRTHSKFVGLRPMLQDLAEDDWILKPSVLENIQVLVDNDFPLDLLILPRHLPYVLDLLRTFPNLRAVVNHLGKPDIRLQITEPWQTYMEQIAAYPGVMCKLSGLVTEADHTAWKPVDMQPYVESAVELFGPSRLMYGSDWPVCTLAASYAEVHDLLAELLPKSLTSTDLADIFGENCVRFYRIDVDTAFEG